MPLTYFQDFTRDDGSLITAEFSYSPGSETTYSPMHGASGGDSCEVQIVSTWPNTPEFERLCNRRNNLTWQVRPGRQLFSRAEVIILRFRIWLQERRARLSDAEREQFEAWIAEHHEPDYPDFEDDYR